MRVYHLSDANYAISNISLRRLKISRFHDLNDPFELLAGNLTDENLRSGTEQMKKEFDQSKGLLCFSRDWENPVLWSHYADKHRGICLGFDLADSYVVEVKYRNARLVPNVTSNTKYGGISKYVLDTLRTKYSHWEYEEEIRAFVGLDEGTIENGLYFFPFSDILVLKEVILGALCEIDLEALEQLLSKSHPDVKLRKSQLSRSSYSVVEDTL